MCLLLLIVILFNVFHSHDLSPAFWGLYANWILWGHNILLQIFTHFKLSLVSDYSLSLDSNITFEKLYYAECYSKVLFETFSKLYVKIIIRKIINWSKGKSLALQWESNPLENCYWLVLDLLAIAFTFLHLVFDVQNAPSH